MKKIKLLLSLIPAIALLSGCSGSNTDSLKLMKDSLLKSGNNVTVTLKDEYDTYFFSEDAFFYDFGSTYESKYGYVDLGYVKTNQGIFRYYLDNNQEVQLDDCYTVSPSIHVHDLMLYPSDLFYKDGIWEKVNSTTYVTSDLNIKSVVGSLSGDEQYSSYLQDITLTFAKAGTIEGVQLSYTLYGLSTTLIFKDFGKTEKAFMTKFMNDPAVVETPTNYPLAMRQDLARVMHDSLPLYEMSYAISYESDKQRLKDLGCGYKVDEFTDLLEEAGYEIESARSSYKEDSKGEPGFVDYVYFKSIIENNVIVGIDYVEVGFTSGCYFDDYYWTENSEYEALYPNGVFVILFDSAQLYNGNAYNSFVQNLCKQYGGFGEDVDFVMSEPNNLVYKNFAGTLTSDEVFEYHTFSGVYVDVTKLKADLNNYINALANAGYSNYYGNDLGQDDVCLYKNNEHYSMNITIAYAEGERTFSITIYVSTPVTGATTIDWADFDQFIQNLHTKYDAVPLLPEGLEAVKDVGFVNMTEIYKEMFETRTADVVYCGYYFTFAYNDDETALSSAKALEQCFKDSGFVSTNEYLTLEEDAQVEYEYTGSEYSITTTVVYEEGVLAYFMMVYVPISA